MNLSHIASTCKLLVLDFYSHLLLSLTVANSYSPALVRVPVKHDIHVTILNPFPARDN